MRSLQRHHHFRGDLIPPDDRLAKLEARIVSLLLETKVADEARDSSIAFELKHQAGVAQCGRILATKRDLDVELAAAGALLHDIYVIVTGSYEDHARRGGPIADELLDQTGNYQPTERDIIRRIVTNHSDKHIVSDDAYVEFGKDADVLDCMLYPDALDEYLLVKPLEKVKCYLARAQSIWAELGIPVPPAFKMLDDYRSDEWLVGTYSVSDNEARRLVKAVLCDDNIHPFAVRKEPSGESYRVYTPLASAEALPMAQLSDESEDSLLEGIQAGEMALIWPGIKRHQILDEDSAKNRGIVER